jgi:hypothetical protein
MPTVEQSDRETWRLLVLNQSRTQIVLASDTTARAFRLPSVNIPHWQRIAENLTGAIREAWHCDASCLFTPTPASAITSDNVLYEVMECLQPLRPDSRRVQVPILGLRRDSFHDEADFLMLHQALLELDSYANDKCAPFVQVGWLRELQRWIAETIRPRHLHLSGSFCQLNASPSFSLIRFTTNGPDVWFKAVGKPNLRELPITLELARLFPSYLPKMIGERPEWNSWLCLSAGDRTLADVRDLNFWLHAATALSKLQADSIGQVPAILSAGARDLRLQELAKVAEAFFVAMKTVMRESQSPRAPLSDEELKLLCIRVQDSITLLEDLNVSNTLGHLDLNPANIVLSQDRCIFLDWADAYVGHPFISFQYLLEHFKREVGRDGDLQSQLSGAYSQVWEDFLPSDVISTAMEQSRLVAAFAYAASLFGWQDETKLRHPEVARSLASMVRRMNREANELRGQVAVCRD